MQYHEAADFLFDLQRFSPSSGTGRIAALLDHLGDPHRDVACVQVAGSNGKGSTARTVERVLREAELSVGLYTQPHFDDVRERVTVDGRRMSRDAVTGFVERAKPFVNDAAAGGESPTFFETVTGMALDEFARQDVDVAVLEVGIGGKADATSVVDPIASAVTTVSLDHTDLLGETVPEIARDKAHVAPADRPLVTGATGEALPTIREVAGEVVTVGGPDADVRAEYGGRVNHGEAAIRIAADADVGLVGRDLAVETHLPTVGAHQATNAGVAAVLARQVGDELGAEVATADLERGIRNAHWPGRFEVMGTDPLVVLDGAHNPAAAAATADALAEYDYDSLRLVTGIMHDKDLRGIAGNLPAAETVVTCHPDLPRAEDEEVLAEVFAEAGAGEVRSRNSVAAALDLAIEAAGEDDAVLVTGSLFAVAEARRRWTRVQVPKRVDDLERARAALEDANVTDDGVWRMRGKGVHRVLTTRVQKRQADYLKQELLSLGGECAVSGQTTAGQLHDVVMMATLAQFKRLANKLDAQPWGLDDLADEIRERLGIGVDPDRRGYPWEDGTAVMGVLNVTPDSFHDGGEYDAVDDAVARAREMVANGADVIDIGGESTRPGADPVPVAEEIDRVVPVIERLADVDALLSVDTRKAGVAEAALEAGADILNDVSGLEDPEMRFLAAEYDVPIVVMHSIETPVDPDSDPEYDDVVEDVIDELTEKVLLAEKAGLDREQVIIDPGVGFGKDARESFELLGRLEELQGLGCPVLVGHSHKSMFEHVGGDAGDCLDETVAATATAVEHGADLVRVHDVAENAAAVRVAEAADDPDRFE